MNFPDFALQGHRGARGLFTENSLPGFAGALALGVTTLELDVGLTRDGHLVVHHDRRLNIDQTRGPDGHYLSEPTPALIDLNLEELAAYEIGRLRPQSQARQEYPEQIDQDGVGIPTLEAFFALCERQSGGRVHYNIEVKTSPELPEESPDPKVMAEKLVASVKKNQLSARAVLQSFDWRFQAAVRAIDPTIALSYLTCEQAWFDSLRRGEDGYPLWTNGLAIDPGPLAVPEVIAELGGVIWSPYFGDLTAQALQRAHELGLRVMVWTVNQTGDMEAMLALGVDGIITDYPNRLRDLLAAQGRSLPPAFTPD